MIIDSLDISIPFSRRHPNETIRDIIRYDSGYLKDLFFKNDSITFSSQCLAEIQKLTAGHRDNWEKPKEQTISVFNQLKSYKTPYLYDFNNKEITTLNDDRLKKYEYLKEDLSF